MSITGLDLLRSQGFDALRGKALGIVCNQATVASDWSHLLDLLLPLHQKGELRIKAVFGPQHGIWGHTQDNMIEWEGYEDPRTGLPFYSLYGEHRKPTAAALSGLDELVIDLPDIGARYYTFMWTMMLCMEAAAELGLPIRVLDRPNPIGGERVEGTVLDPEFESFVGLHPLPMRHGMTLGELAALFQADRVPNLDLKIVRHSARDRSATAASEAPWVMPSPNMPTRDTALVYPGQCLLEGTSLSEGRGTTRPFETFGAPGIDGWRLAAHLNRIELSGAHFRPVTFLPTFQKHAGTLCEGAFIHVTEPERFRPVMTSVAILQSIRGLFPEALTWNDPPYEYETKKLPIDILAGNAWLREAIDSYEPLPRIEERMRAECEAFAPRRLAALARAEELA